MSRTHAVVIAVLLASNVVLGTFALTHTLRLGQASHKASSTLVAKRTSQLDRFEASLRAQLGKKPPRLPKVPAAPATYAAPAVPAATVAPQVRYVRPAPIVIHKHRAGGEHETERGDGGGGADD